MKEVLVERKEEKYGTPRDPLWPVLVERLYSRLVWNLTNIFKKLYWSPRWNKAIYAITWKIRRASMRFDTETTQMSWVRISGVLSSNCINCFVSPWRSVHIHYFLPPYSPFYITNIFGLHVSCDDGWTCFDIIKTAKKNWLLCVTDVTSLRMLRMLQRTALVYILSRASIIVHKRATFCRVMSN